MDSLTASNEQHRKAMRGLTSEIAAKLLQNYYGLTDEQAMRAQRLRDADGMTEDDAIKVVLDV